MSRGRGIIWIVVGLILAIGAAGVSYVAFQQVTTQQANTVEENPTQTVVVAKQLINERAVVRLADVGTEEREVAQVPSGAIFKTEDAVGRVSTRSIQPGQILLAQNLVESFSSGNLESVEPVTSTINFNEALGEDLVAYALPATDRLSAEGIFLPGDHIDLLFSTDVFGAEEEAGGKVAIYAIQDIEILQIIYQPPPPKDPNEDKPQEPAPDSRIPKTLILALEPSDAVVLKYALDIAAPIDLALRAEDNRLRFDVDAVTINTIAERYDFLAPKPLP